MGMFDFLKRTSQEAPQQPAATPEPAAAYPSSSNASPDGDAIGLNGSFEFPALGFQSSTSGLAMASLQGITHEADSRAPLQIVAVLDKSGSMSGEKIKLVRETMKFVVGKAMRPMDQLAIVSFDTSITTDLAFVTMDAGGKREALEKIENLRPGSQTNLSGGLFKGLDLMQQLPADANGSSRCVLLFTDGLANQGVREADKIVEGLESFSGSCSVFTFGFGADHDENMLSSIASAAGGLYYYIENTDAIPQAFADVMGGLLSVVAQNLQLSATAGTECTIESVHGSWKHTATDSGFSVDLGDLYSEEARDILFTVTVPAIPATLESQVVINLKLDYFDVVNCTMRTISLPITVSRPESTPAGQNVNPVLDKQRNRIRVATAIERSSALADAGDMQMAQQEMDTILETIQTSVSAMECQAYVSQVQELQSDLVDRDTYRREGGKKMKMYAMCHQKQRATHSMAEAAPEYSNAKKAATKSSWFGR